jgi:hypothetical protein
MKHLFFLIALCFSIRLSGQITDQSETVHGEDFSRTWPDTSQKNVVKDNNASTRSIRREAQATPASEALHIHTNGDIEMPEYQAGYPVNPEGRIPFGGLSNVAFWDTSGVLQLSELSTLADSLDSYYTSIEPTGYYWITNHGATANDGTNDRDSIQALLDYVESIGGGTIIVPIGVFNIMHNANNEGLYIGDNITFRGFGSGSEIRYTGHDTQSSTAIQNRRSSGQYTTIEQRVGNKNIHIQGIKLTFTERDDFKNIGINLSGVDWGSIKDTWVDSCGGYSFLIARTNDTDTLGNFSENIVLENIKVTNMLDVGLEVWGAENITARDIDISGRGTDVGYGQGIYVWNGAKNVHIYNAKIEKDTNDFDGINRYMIAFSVGSLPYGDTITYAHRTQNITFENIDSRTDMGFRINGVNDVDPIHRVDSIAIRNCNFLGYDTIRNSSDIRHCKTLLIEGCTFDRFARHLQFSTASNTTEQNSVSDIIIRNNSFTWGEGIDFHGITDFSIRGNRFYKIFDQAPITVRGGRSGAIKNNYFFDIGIGSDQWCITLRKLTASLTRETREIKITGNTACDDRTLKHTDDLITMYDATDSITVKYNVLDCAVADAVPYNNLGTGTSIFTVDKLLQDHDFYAVGTTSAPTLITQNIYTEAPQVGMGTTSPETNLHIQGSGLVVTRVESTAGQAQLNIKGSSFGEIENTNGTLYISNASSGGDLIFKTDNSTEKLRLTPSIATFSVPVNIPTSPPSSSSAFGVVGTITWDDNYLYVCTATNTWSRVPIGTW